MKITERNYPYNKTIHQLFEEQVAKTPGNIAVVGQRVGKGCRFIDTSFVTYGELDRKANQVSRVLRARGVTADTIAAVMVERSIEMVVGILGILKAGGAYMPIDPHYPAERINYMLRESGAKVVLTQEPFLLNKAGSIADVIDLEEPELYSGPHSKLEPLSDATDIAYIIYTSGSTGRPKGVAVEHRSAVNLLTALSDAYPLSPTDGYLLKTSFLFDVSVSELFGWFLGGSRLIILERDGEKDPQTIIDTIEATGVTHINFVPAMFNAFTQHLDPQNIGKITGLKYIFLAGEALVPELVSRFRRLNTSIQLENLYGPTEGTVYASWYSLSGWNGIGSIPIGKALPNVKLYILGDDGHEKAMGEAGELCIAGAGVARGYLNNPDLTAETFDQDFQDDQDEKGPASREPSRTTLEAYIPTHPLTHSPIYRTGDLARWLPDGNIEFLERMDFQVKIRGFRVELEEIENRLLKHETIKEAVVTARVDENNDRYLCAYVVPSGTYRGGASLLKEYLSQTLPDYMVPSFFVTLDQLPLTDSGKVDRKSLPEPEVVTEAEYVAPRDEIEEKLAELWSGILGIEKHRIGIDDNFFELGGHSLKGTALVLGIHKTFNVRLQLSELFKTPVIRKLSAYIKEAAEDRYLPLQTAETKDYYALSSAQKRLYVLHQINLEGIAYNIPLLFELEKAPDRQKLEDAFKKLISRHESLRTSFRMINEVWVQKIHKEVEFDIEYYDLDNEEKETIQNSKFKIQNSFIRPFDLYRAPLLRVGLLRLNEEEHLLMVDMHHIISDGLSIDVFVKELVQAYDSKTLSPLRAQYKDYSEWENRQKREQALKLKSQQEYWLREFSGEIPVLLLPLDYARPMMQNFDGNTLYVELEENENKGLNALASSEDATLYMLFLAAYNILLAKLSGQEDIVIGTPLAGRKHVELRHVVGMFVKTLALRNFPRGEKRFNGFLKELKERTLIAFENQDSPFEELVEAVVEERDMSRNPLFDCMFGLENIEAGEYGAAGLKMKSCRYNINASKIDLTLTVEELEENLTLRVEYCTKLFKQETIERFTRYFKKILSTIQKEPGKKISEIAIIPDEEKREIVEEFNDTRTDYPQDKTIHQLFEEQLERVPDNIALIAQSAKHRTQSDPGETPGKRLALCAVLYALTYRELNRKSNQLASLLIEKGVSYGDIVGIMVERSAEMVIGLLAVLKAGGAYLPISPNYPEERKRYMLADSNVEILLLDCNGQGTYEGEAIDITDPGIYNGEPVYPDSTGPHSLAYVIYTSGSTGEPKGVMVEHQSVVRLVKYTNYLVFREGDRVLQTGAIEFDASTFEIWGALLNGLQLHVAVRDVILVPERLKTTIQQNNITTMWMTSPLFNQMLQADVHIFGGLKNLLVGGDVLSLPHINKLRRAFPGLNIINGYGPTENTTFSTTFSIKKEYTLSIPIGRPISNSTVYIVGKDNHLVPVGIYGEILVGGDGLARGYLNNPDLTAEKYDQDFQDYQDDRDEKGPASREPFKRDLGAYNLTHPTHLLTHSPIYRTGDLGRWLPDGSIAFLGRVDHQVKIRGFRVEPGEIESRLLAHEEINETVVMVKDSGSGNKYLCAYVVTRDAAAHDKMSFIAELREYLSHILPGYMVPSFFILLEQLPLTSSGKVDRKALPEPEIVSGVEYVPPRGRIKEKLVEIWADALGMEKAAIGIDDNFFKLGGNSLNGAVVASGVHKTFNVRLKLSEQFRMPSIRQLYAYIKEAAEDQYLPMEKVEEKVYYALSSAQERLYILYRMMPESTVYNIPLFFELENAPGLIRLEHALKKLISRHESLRTSFHMVNEEPVQKIHKEVEFHIDYYDLVNEGKEIIQNSKFKIQNSLIRPFDLSRAPLLRVGLLKSNEGKHILMVDMHHIITDGLSMDVFERELRQVYDLEELPLLRIQYKEYTEWENRKKREKALKSQRKYWLKEFSGKIPVLSLPLDYARPMVQSFEGNTICTELKKSESKELNALAKAENVTLYMLFLAAYNILLAKLSGQEDITLGTPLAGRKHVELRQVIGMFVKTLALRNFPKGEKRFNEFLKEVKERTLTAFENQDYPFEELVEVVGVERDVSRNPLFDCMFGLENIEAEVDGSTRLKMKACRYNINVSKFDLTLTVEKPEENLTLRVEYCTKLFKQETIERFTGYFKKILSTIHREPGRKISEIEMMPDEEKRKIVEEFNDTRTDYPQGKAIHHLFEEQVERTPDNTAVVGMGHGAWGMVSLTYRELNNRSDRLAHRLMEKGVKPGTIAAIMMERSIKMVKGVLAILKAGGAYMPIDPNYPGERIQYILADSGAMVLLTDLPVGHHFNCQLPIVNCQLSMRSQKAPFHHSSLIIHHFPFDSLAYIIYTSGSTGMPKGVAVEHHSAVNILFALFDAYPVSPSDAYLLKTAFLFDVSVTELFGWFMGGSCLVVLKKNGEKDPQTIIDSIEEHRVTHINFVPAMFNAFVSYLDSGNINKIAGLKYIFLAGEALVPELVSRFRRFNTSIRLENLYGPTEGTVYASGYSLSQWSGTTAISIGKPLPNVKLFIQDKEGHAKAIGETGELCIAGAGVARGYLNNPELTADKFDRDFQDLQDDQDENMKKGTDQLRLIKDSNMSDTSYLSYLSSSPYLKLYRTGDLCRWLPDGNIDFLGRIDFQVKIRGFRVELGEIENRLLKNETIKKAVVVAREEEKGVKYLCAYIVFVSGQELSVSHLRDYLARQLPGYMIPQYFLPMEKIPLTPSGKVDRKRLPEPERYRPKLDTDYMPPSTELEKIIGNIWKEVLKLENVGVHDKFFELGGNSMKFIQVNHKLQEFVGEDKDMPVITMFQYPTIHSLARHLSGEEEDREVSEPQRTALARPGDSLDIAVIGMAGRFPGAKNIQEFWENLKNGAESITFFSDEELEEAGVSSELLKDADYVKARGFLEDTQYFDASFFNYTPKEADAMDPQLRLYHECTWSALEDAGYNPGTYRGRIGVYTGAYTDIAWISATLNDTRSLSERYDVFSLNNASGFGTRISYKLGLRGPSFSLQTACSTSLVAVHLACRGLLNHECDISLAGGVAISSPKKSGYLFQEGLILSSDAHNRTFDAEANGTVPGDGIGIVVLKRLEEAVADRDHIYAVVKGTAVNNDGTRKVGYTAPSIEGQAEVIQEAMKMAKVAPESITYVETHGTATTLGDPIEIEGLKLAFHTSEKQFCPIGSVKSNVGHLDTTSGIAGFIKTVLALNHGLIPPSLHYKKTNSKIDFENSPFHVNTELKVWKNEKYPLRAGVSSFGIGGTNAHAILEEAPVHGPQTRDQESGGRGYQLILLSARTAPALDKMRENLCNYLKENLLNPENHGLNLADVSFTLQTGRKSFKYRGMTVCSTIDEAIEHLSETESSRFKTFSSPGKNRSVVFMFPGQGSQYVNMGLELYRKESRFRKEMDRCFDILKPLMGCDLKEVLYPLATRNSQLATRPEKINQTEIAQPVIFAIQYSLAKLLMAWGITPCAMIGHSIGEYTAACLAKVFSLEDALTLVALRGKLMQQLPPGAMLSVPLPEQEVISRLMLDEKLELSLAAVNGPSSCVVSGTQKAVDTFAKQLKERGYESRSLHTSHAFHSKMMDPILEEFLEKVKQISFNQPQIPYLSNATGQWITGEAAAEPGYWVTHLRHTVRFFDGLTELLKKEEKAVLAEVGPGRVLSTFARQHPTKTPNQLILNLVRHPKESIPDDRYLLSKIGSLWLYGREIDWEAVYPGETRRRIPLPSYPFERHPYRIGGEAFSIVGAKTPAEETQLNKKTDITDWFYTPSWKRVRLPLYEKKQVPGQTTWLLFTHEHALCKRLKEHLKREDQEVIVVKQGTTFKKKDEREFTLNPRQEGDYDALFNELHSMERFPQRILHLWGLASSESRPLDIDAVEEELDTGFYSLLNITQVVGKLNFRDELKIDVVTDNMQEVTGEEQLCPAKAAVLGPVKIIPLEYPNIRCRSIDIVFSDSQRQQYEGILTQLLEELSREAPSPSVVVALRRRHRWVRDFEPIRLEKHPGPIPRLRQGGVYLITGGLGGIGLVLARYLADRVKAKLVLTDQSDFPAPETWDQWLDKHPGNDKVSEKIREIQELEKSGAKVWVVKGDVANMEEMKAAMEKIKERFGPVNGVIHSAGMPDGRLIHLRTREFTESILAPKVRGTLVLDSLFQSHDQPDFFVLCSSLNSIIGEIGQVGYTAANCFLDAFASHKAVTGGFFTVSINWDAWQEKGMAKEALENTITRDPNRETVTSRFSPKNQWVMGEHKVNGTATLVGTAYLEMVNAAFERHAKGQNIEIRDLYYLAPLFAGEDEEKEVCIILEKEEAQWKFSIISRSYPGENQWQVHTRGKLAAAEAESIRTLSIENIREKCRVHQQDQQETSIDESGSSAQSQLITVGRRWDNLKEVWYGENQGLALLELPGEFFEDIESHKLHPALLDSATAFLIDSLHSREAYLPFSYKRVKIKGPLPAKVYSYARLVEKDPSQKQALEFNITIMDETGKELIDIERLTVLAISKEKKENNEQRELVTPASLESVQSNPLKDAILSHEGVEVFERILSDTLPQAVVSTADFLLRLEKAKDRRTPGLAETPGEESAAGPGHPRPELSTSYVAPKTGIQKILAAIWQEYLGIREIGIHDDFFELGADSLKALSVIARIHKKLNVEVSITEIFSSPTIAGLAEYIEGAGESIYTSITPVEEKEYYPLSSAQTRLYFLQQLQRESVFYNLPFVCIVEGQLDMSRLEEAFQALIQRYESLRTSFELRDDEPIQKIHRTVDFKVKYHGTERTAQSAKGEEKSHAPCAVRHASTIKHFVRPFDLTHAPLVRMEVVKIGKEKYLWLFDIHHIITDATGYAVLQKDLVKLYDKKKLHALRIQYKDFSAWQNRLIRSEENKEQEKYWLNVYSDSGEIPKLNMPTDFPRPEKLRFQGGRFYFKLGTEETQKFKELGSHAGATLFANLLSVLNVLLFKYTGQNDIIVGGSIAGRPHADLQDIVGMFVNILPIRIHPDQEMTYWELLKQVKTTSLNAFENQDMQFEMLVEQLKPMAETSRNPLFDICLNVQNYEQPEIEIKGLAMTPCPYEPDTSKFDMLVWANLVGDDIHFMLEYSTELFKPSSVEEFSKHFIEIVQQVIKNKEIPLKDIKLSHKVLTPESDVPEIDFGF